MAGTPGTFRFPEVNAKPAAPPAGYALIYIKTDNVLYLQDSSGVEIALGSASAITQLVGEATGIGPGVTTVTLSNAAVIAKLLTGFTAGPNSAVVATDSILQGIQKLQAQISATVGSAITALVGDVSASGPGSVTATVNSVGGSSAAAIHAAELLANAATSINTASAIVRRDASGNFAANVITAATFIGNLTGNASGSAASFTGSLVGDVTGTQGATVISSTTVTSKLLTGLATGPNTAILAGDSILVALEKLQAQVSGSVGTAITALTGDVSATGPGSVAATVNSVGGSTAALIHAAELLANAATDTNTASAIVKRDALGAFSAGIITASLNGNAATATTSVSFSGALLGDVTGTQGATVVSKIQGTAVTGTTGSGNVVLSASPTLTGTLTGSAANFSGVVTASNISGSNTGDVTVSDTNSIALGLTGQALTATLKLSTDAADAGNLKATTTVHGGVGAAQGLHVEVPFGNPVNIGTTNNSGSAPSMSLSDHVHAITFGVVGGLLLTGFVVGSNTPIVATNSILIAFQNIQAQINATVAAAITALTGDVTATGPGSVAATISVGAVTDTKASLSNKPAVTVVATTNQALTGTPTIDGQATTAGTSIVLLTAQTTASDNGPWVVQTGAWTRPTWFPNGGTTQSFQFITTLVRLGTVYQGSTWRQTTAGPITIGTTATAWAVVPLSGNYKSVFNIGPASGSANVDLNFSNAFVGTLRWNPTVSQTLTLPPTQGAAGTVPFNDGAGNLSWANPLLNIDGGRPDSVYTASQFINGGTP